MKKIILFILVLLTIGCSSDKVSYKKIDNNKLTQVMGEVNDYTIIDVRSLVEYNDGHIEDAINIPLDGITSDTMQNIDTNEILIVYCKSGNRSKQAALKLIELGYINVYDYGSIDNYDGEIIKETSN